MTRAGIGYDLHRLAENRKLILGDDGAPWLFFDLENDPLEMKNLAGDQARAAEILDWSARVR